MIHGLAETYGDRAAGDLTALLGSSNRLEIAVVAGSAQKTVAGGVGDKIVVSRGE